MNEHIEQPVSLKIESVYDEAADVKTFTFKHRLDAEPGQFVMLWIPRAGMKPFGVSYHDKETFSVTVSRVGGFTEELFNRKKGEYVGILGPYGNSFSMQAKKPVLVAGGYGSAPLAFLAERLEKQGAEVTLIIGARNKKYLTYKERFRNSGTNVIYCTDDGSEGIKGFTTEALKQTLQKDGADYIYTVGPEIMMQKVIELADEFGVDCEASLERYMKCGFGICGQCCVDDTGERVCKTGPVYSKGYIQKNIKEFGNYKRDATGKKEYFR